MFVIKRLSQKSALLRRFICVSTATMKNPKNLDEIQKAERLGKESSEHYVNNLKNNQVKEEFKEKLESTTSDFNNLDEIKDKEYVKSNQASLKHSTKFNKKLFNTIEVLADNFGGDVNKTKSELNKSVRVIHGITETGKKNKMSSHSSESKNRGKTISQQHKFQKKSKTSNAFDPKTSEKSSVNQLKKWRELQERELKLVSTVPPRNYFEELIQWTDQGKIWHFPIDNDQGRHEEAATHFTNHIFLEEHLEPWCPKRGPVRHFMELIIVGLSKNHTLTVKDKIEHILWYKDYFEKKKKLLSEVGALSTKNQIEDSNNLEKTT